MILFILFASSCRKDEYETFKGSNDISYYNLKLGSYVTYDVTEIVYDDFTNSIDTSVYEVKEYNESVYTDNLGRKGIKLDRYIKNKTTGLWDYLNSYYSVNGQNSIERVEENKRMIKLSFPVTTDAVWNSNSLNMDNAINVFYGLIRKKYQQDAFKFESVISVESANVINSFRERSFREIYAKNIGLIFKYYVNIEKNGNIWRGIKLTYRLKDYAL
ncbi:MAG TPA: hypothetical protein VGF79_03690 [Bacteroidia bacterium]